MTRKTAAVAAALIPLAACASHDTTNSATSSLTDVRPRNILRVISPALNSGLMTLGVILIVATVVAAALLLVTDLGRRLGRYHGQTAATLLIIGFVIGLLLTIMTAMP